MSVEKFDSFKTGLAILCKHWVGAIVDLVVESFDCRLLAVCFDCDTFEMECCCNSDDAFLLISVDVVEDEFAKNFHYTDKMDC